MMYDDFFIKYTITIEIKNPIQHILKLFLKIAFMNCRNYV
jgi:hypothetical protein